MNSWRILHGDVRERLADLEAGSVRCCVTSPPYWGLRDYGVSGQLGLEVTPEAYVAAMVAVFAGQGLASNFTGWLMIHGTTELFAIVLAGAAGFSIGWAVTFPGERSRVDAAAEAGRRAATAMAGVVCMLLVAGLLEGFGRQLITNDIARYVIAAVMLVAWLAYFYWPRRSVSA